MNRTTWIALVLGFAVLVTLAIVMRSKQAAPAPVSQRVRHKATVKSGYYVPPERPEKASPDAEMVKAMDDAQIKSTYGNFRTAVATGNRRLEGVLRPVLLRNKESAVKLAEEDLAQAKSETDRSIAMKALESLTTQ